MIEQRHVSRFRIVWAVLIGMLATIYTGLVVLGMLPKDHQIDAVHLALIALSVFCIALLLSPEISERLKILEVKGFKIEMLEEVKERQAQQESRLEDIALMLPLLLPETERNHLRNLAQGTTLKYKDRDSLKVDLRRLRSIGLIRSRSGQAIGDIPHDSLFDLAAFVELTELGKRWVKRIQDIERFEREERQTPNQTPAPDG
ncbi:MAG: hypothetical protein ACJ76Y_12705 [Thermoanaerobaculia bacterium]